MGRTPGSIRDAIAKGWLEAETLTTDGRRKSYRIHLNDFRAFLRAIGWTRLPTRSG